MVEIEGKLKIKALGQTIKYKGETILAVEDMPDDCMVLFVDMDTWQEIKENVEINIGKP